MDAPTAHLADSPLYQELLKIGRDELSIRADKLTQYEHLLNCPEVQRRAGLHADKTRLAQCASDAIREAIALIVSVPTREIAEAALCANKTFEGRLVKERAGQLGVTLRQFKYRRDLALGEIVAFLTRDAKLAVKDAIIQKARPQPSPVSLLIPFNRLTALDHLHLLARMVARLHYASLGVLFAYDFDDELAEKDVAATHLLEGWHRRTALAQYLFYEYMRFVYEHWSVAYLRKPATEEYLVTAIADQLWLLRLQIADASPAGPKNVTEEQRQTLELEGNPENSPTARKIYNEKWHDWCKGHGPVHDKGRVVTRTRDHLFDAVTPIASLSGAFVAILTQHVKLDFPLHSQSRVTTYKALSNCYQFDEFVPVANGRPLRYRAETYFDLEGPRLTYMALP
jgi:hypothetical protein